MSHLEKEAADPGTSAIRLHELASNHPNLRPLIAINPSTYPGLVTWLAQLDDPAVNLALKQRVAAEASRTTPASGPRRVSVLGRADTGSGTGRASSGTSSDGNGANGNGSNGKGPNGGAIPRPVDPTSDTREGEDEADAPTSDLPVLTAAQTGGAGGAAASGPGSGSAPAYSPAYSPAMAHEQSPALATESPRKNENNKTKVLIAVIAVLAAVAIALALILIQQRNASQQNQADGGSAAGQSAENDQDSSAAGSDENTEEPADDPTKEDPDQPLPIQFPAPPNALNSDHFVSPSGNIACIADGESMKCTIRSRAFDDPTLPDCGREAVTLRVTQDEVGLACDAESVSTSGAATLSYTDYAATGDFACHSSQFGISCWNIVSGKAFALAREGYLTGDRGQILVADFPWTR